SVPDGLSPSSRQPELARPPCQLTTRHDRHIVLCLDIDSIDAMPIQLVEAQRLYQQVADQISGLIRTGELGSGARLPPERELARQLGVSRPVVREAMIALEIAGLVEVRVGAGAFVRRPRAGPESGGEGAGARAADP